MDQKPSIGRVVHYVAYGTPGGEFPSGVCRAAVVTEVNPSHDMEASLFIMNPTGVFMNRNLPYDEEKSPGSWHWPERV